MCYRICTIGLKIVSFEKERFLGAFHKIVKSDYFLRHVRPSVHMGYYCMHFHGICYFYIFRKPVQMSPVLFKSDEITATSHGAAWGSVVVKALRYWSDGPGTDSRWCHWILQWHISFRPYHGPGVDSAPSENEYQEYFLGLKAVGAWGWQTHHLHVPNVMKSGSIKLLEPSGPHRACYGTALPLPYIYIYQIPNC